MSFFRTLCATGSALVAALFLSGCGYSRSQVTITGMPGAGKPETFEPAILDRMPTGKVQLVANATKTYQAIGWAKDACRDLGCDAVVITGQKPRQSANLVQMSSSTGSSGLSPVQTHTEYAEYLYQFLVLP